MNYNFTKLDKNILKIWYVEAVLLFLLIEGIIWPICFFAGEEINLVAIIFGAALTLMLGLLIFIFPYWKYKCASYYYDEKRIIINKGVIFKHHIVVPVCQIQDLHIYEGPLMQIVKLDGIVISTAGSNFILKGLSKDDGEKMLKDLENNLHKRLEATNDEEIH